MMHTEKHDDNRHDGDSDIRWWWCCWWLQGSAALQKAKCQGELILMLETGHVWPGSVIFWHCQDMTTIGISMPFLAINTWGFYKSCLKNSNALLFGKTCFSQIHCWPVTLINKNMSLELQGWTFLGVSMSWQILWERDLTENGEFYVCELWYILSWWWTKCR